MSPTRCGVWPRADPISYDGVEIGGDQLRPLVGQLDRVLRGTFAGRRARDARRPPPPAQMFVDVVFGGARAASVELVEEASVGRRPSDDGGPFAVRFPELA